MGEYGEYYRMGILLHTIKSMDKSTVGIGIWYITWSLRYTIIINLTLDLNF